MVGLMMHPSKGMIGPSTAANERGSQPNGTQKETKRESLETMSSETSDTRTTRRVVWTAQRRCSRVVSLAEHAWQADERSNQSWVAQPVIAHPQAKHIVPGVGGPSSCSVLGATARLRASQASWAVVRSPSKTALLQALHSPQKTRCAFRRMGVQAGMNRAGCIMMRVSPLGSRRPANPVSLASMLGAVADGVSAAALHFFAGCMV